MAKDDHITLGQMATILGRVDDELDGVQEQIEKTDKENDAALAAHIADRDNPHGLSAENIGAVPAGRKINGKTLDKDINLSAADLGIDSAEDADAAVSAHNTSDSSHGDIRELITGLADWLNALDDSEDEAMDQLSELVAVIKANRSNIQNLANELNSMAAGMDELSSAAVTIPVSSWKTNSDSVTVAAGLAYYADVTVSGLTETDMVDTVLDYGSLEIARSCQMSGTCNSQNGYIRYYAAQMPAAGMTATVYIHKGADE